MKNIHLLCVGKLKESYLKEACAEYLKRLGSFCHMEIIEVNEERLPEQPSAAQIQLALKAEGRRLLAKAGANTYQISLCIEGKMISSPELSACLDRLAVEDHGDITFIIGGSWGLSDEVKMNSQMRLSMSPMTFPHQLARVMVLEQIYRAMQISAGGKYHK